MTHCQLALNLSCCLKNNAYHDYDRGAAEGKAAHCVAGEDVQHHGEHGDERKEYSTYESNPVQHPGDIIGSRFTGTDTGDGSAVLLQIV